VKGKGGNIGIRGLTSGKRLPEAHATANSTTSTNPFVVLNPPEDQTPPILEEGEVQQHIE